MSTTKHTPLILSDIHYRFWTQEDVARCERSETLFALAQIAIDIMGRFPRRVRMVSGPISSGQGTSTEHRRRIFTRAVEKRIEAEPTTFSQMPFEQFLHRYYLSWKKTICDVSYCWPIIYEFYDRIFATGLVETLDFLPGYQTSIGARWEHENAIGRGIRRNYLPDEFRRQIEQELAEEDTRALAAVPAPLTV